MGAHVQLTDTEEAMPLLQQNIEQNEQLLQATGGTMRCQVLDWQHLRACSHEHPLDLVLGADLVYNTAAVPLTVGVLSALSAPDCLPTWRLLLAHKHRSDAVDECLLSAFEDSGLALTRVARGAGDNSSLSIYEHWQVHAPCH